LLVGNMSMVGLQALQFFALARVLGAESFGHVAAVNALLTLALPLTDLGFGSLMQQRTARSAAAAPLEFGTATAVCLAGGSVLITVLALAVPWIYPARELRGLVLLQGVAELLAFRSVTLCNQLCIALEDARTAGRLNVLISASRVLSIGLILLFPGHGPLPWAAGTAVLSTLLAAVTYARMIRRIGGFAPSLEHARREARNAVHFALSSMSRGLFADTDKVLLGRYGTSAALGVYVAAYRIVAMGMMPVRSLLQATTASLARSGAQGLDAALKPAYRMLRMSSVYGAVAMAGLLAGADLLPVLLGDTYASSVGTLRILSALLMIQNVQLAFTAALNGAGLQRAGARTQLAALAAYATLAYLVIPRYGTTGAAVACVAGESLLAGLVFVTVQALRRKPAAEPTTST
jgi:O-antigen/teichoic acid export membrane protein